MFERYHFYYLKLACSGAGQRPALPGKTFISYLKYSLSGMAKIVLMSIIAIFMLPVSVIHAADVSLIYCDTPPAGEQYYTACIACSNLDGNPGDELVLSDDYGAYQILSWDSINMEFIEKWVSNPEFEIHRVIKIFLPPVSSNESAFLVFLDTLDDLHLFQWMEYMVSDVGVIHFNSTPGNEWVKDFTAGEFSSKLSGWEMITLRCGSIAFDGISFTYGILNTGNFTPELRQHAAAILFNIEKESHLEIDHYMGDKPQGLLIVSDNPASDGHYRIHKTYPPFNKYRQFRLPANNVEKIGWAGQIDKSGISYLTYFVRSEDADSKISFFRMDDNPATIFDVSVPSNTSKWVLGDINGDGTRELIVLDFLGKLSVFDLSNAL